MAPAIAIFFKFMNREPVFALSQNLVSSLLVVIRDDKNLVGANSFRAGLSNPFAKKSQGLERPNHYSA
jgi:hypothetical protein